MEFSEVWEWRLLHDPVGLRGAERSRPILNDPERECLTHDIEELMTMSPIDSQGLPSDATEGVWDSRIRRPSAYPSTSSFGSRAKPVVDHVKFVETDVMSQHSKRVIGGPPSSRGCLGALLNEGGQAPVQLLEGNTRRVDVASDLKQMRVHLPCRGRYLTVNIVTVKMNTHTKVQELIEDIVREYGASHNLPQTRYELRLLDEEEGGPDLDWPPFDPQRALTNAQVSDVVLCVEGLGDSASESRPSRSNTGTSADNGESPTQQLGSQKSDSARDGAAHASVLHSFGFSSHRRPALRIDENAAGAESVEHARRRSDELEIPGRLVAVSRLTHRRVRSTPAGPLMGSEEEASPAPVSGAEKQVVVLVELPIALDEHTHELYFGARRELPSSGVVRVQVGVAVAHEYIPDHIGSVSSESVTAVPLVLTESASLQQVLHMLYRKLPSSEAAAEFDAHSYAFECEREGDVRRRLDPNMQVRHLDPNDVLTLVRRDGDVTHSGLGGPGDSVATEPSRDIIRRPPVWTINFNDYTASIACQYLVRVLPKNSIRNARKHQCHLVVDADKLSHKMMEDEAQRASTSAIGHALQRVKRGITGEISHTVLYSERRLSDVERAEVLPNNKLGFVLVFRERGSTVLTSPGLVELNYEAESPQHCAEIIARVQHLMNMRKRA